MTPDPQGPELVGEGEREQANRRLGGGIDRHRSARPDSAHTRHVDDRASSPAHDAGGGLAPQEDALHVDAHDVVVVDLGHLEDVFGERDSGVVHHDVEPAHVLGHLYGGREIGRVGRVGVQVGRPRAELLDQDMGWFARTARRVACIRNHDGPGALLRKPQADGPADPARPSGDESHSSLEQSSHPMPPPRCRCGDQVRSPTVPRAVDQVDGAGGNASN